MEMPRSALLVINWEAQFHSRLPALLSGGASVSEGIGEPLELSLILAFTSLPMNSRLMARVEPKLASAAHEDTGVELSMAPLVLARLLGRVPLPLPDLGQTSESTRSRPKYLHEADLLVQVFLDLFIELRNISEEFHLLRLEGGRLPVRRQGGHDVVVRWLLARQLGASEERSGGLDPGGHI